MKDSAAAILLQTTIVIDTDCTERWLSYKSRILMAGTNWSQERIYLRNRCQHFERWIRVLWFLTEVSSRLLDQQPASVAAWVFFVVVVVYLVFNQERRLTYFAGLMLLLNFVQGFWSSCVLRFVSETSKEFIFRGFPLCSECCKFASHSQSVFRSFHVMVVSFQIPRSSILCVNVVICWLYFSVVQNS